MSSQSQISCSTYCTTLNSVEEATFFYQDWDVQEVMVARLCRELWPLARDFKLEMVCDWSSFNRIIGIDVIEDAGDVYRYILRVPRPTEKYLRERDGTEVAEMEEIGHCVATLKYLELMTPISAPQVVCFDKTGRNCLGYPYVIITRIPGECLHFVLKRLSQERRLQLAGELGQLLGTFQLCRSPVAGTLREADSTKNGCGLDRADAGVIPLGASLSSTAACPLAKDPAGPDSAPLPEQQQPPDEEAQEYLTAKGVLAEAFERRMAQLKTHEHNFPVDLLEMWIDVLADCQARGFEWGWIDDEYGNCLFHNDLYPRNIMVDPDATPMITGIIDWDDALFLPKFMTCVAPAWLLRPQDPPSEQKLGIHTILPTTPEQMAIKEAFDKEAGEEFVRNAYNERHMLMRAVGRITLVGNWDCQTHLEYSNCREEWMRLMGEFAEEVRRMPVPSETESGDESGDEWEDEDDDDAYTDESGDSRPLQ